MVIRILILFLCVAACAQDPGRAVTSTLNELSIMPGSVRFDPPKEIMVVEMKTNTEPLVVRQTVSSNVIKRIYWYYQGRMQITDSTIVSNVVMVTTNDFTQTKD